MSKNKGSHPHLIKIVQHSIRITKYLSETSKEDFFQKQMNYDAILKQIDVSWEFIGKYVEGFSFRVFLGW